MCSGAGGARGDVADEEEEDDEDEGEKTVLGGEGRRLDGDFDFDVLAVVGRVLATLDSAAVPVSTLRGSQRTFPSRPYTGTTLSSISAALSL